jgi:hypothetical protein
MPNPRPHILGWLAQLGTNPGIVVGLCVLFHLSIVIPLAALLPIWIDEAYTLNTTGSSLSYALHQALHFELQAPLYFLVVAIWRKICAGIFFARLFSVLCTCIALVIIGAVCRRILPSIHAGWVVITAALNPFLIGAAVDIRLYAFVILLSSLLTLFFWDGFFEARRPRPAQAAYCICAVLALYTQYYMGFLLAAYGLSLLPLQRRQGLRDYVIVMVMVAVLFMPMMLFLPYQMGQHPMPTREAVDLWRGTGSILRTLSEFTLPLTRLAPIHEVLLRGGAVALLFVILSVNVRRVRSVHMTVWISMVALAVCLFAVLFLVGRDLMRPRHTSVIWPLVILSVYAVISLLPTQRLRLMLAGWTLLVVCGSVAKLVETYSLPTKPWDAKRLAAFVEQYEHPGEPILLFTSELALPFSYYYHGCNPLLPLPKPASLITYDLTQFILNDESEIECALDRVPGQHRKVWLLWNHLPAYMGVQYNGKVLENYIGKNYEVEIEQSFNKSSARLLRAVRQHPEGQKEDWVVD